MKAIGIAMVLVCASAARAQLDSGNIYAAAYSMSGQQAYSVAAKLRGDGKEDQAYDTFWTSLQQFALAYNLFPTSETAYDVALCYYKLDAPFMAQIWLRRYYKGLRKGEHPSPDADHLAAKIVANIEDFWASIHYDFQCDIPKQTCHYATNW